MLSFQAAFEEESKRNLHLNLFLDPQILLTDQSMQENLRGKRAKGSRHFGNPR